MKRRFERIFNKELHYGDAWNDYKAVSPLKHKKCLCGAPATQRHHVIAARRGGAHAEANIEFLCDACHTAKHPHMTRRKRHEN